MLALLGPNGAGKTTLIKVLSTLLVADAGRALVGGFDVTHQPEQVRRLISLTGQHAAVDDVLTGTENLVLMARLSGLDARHRATTCGRAARGLRSRTTPPDVGSAPTRAGCGAGSTSRSVWSPPRR